MTPDLILFNANVLTMDPILPKARIVGTHGGKCLAVGGNADFNESRWKNTQVIDSEDKAVLPGFIDAHCHLRSFTESFVTLDLNPRNGVYSLSNVQAKIRSFSPRIPPSYWIMGKASVESFCSL